MRKTIVGFLLALVLAALPGSARAQAQGARENVGTVPGSLTALGYCQLSVTTAVALSTCSGGIPTGAVIVYITPETAAIRWRDDGTAPTTTVGNPVGAGAQLVYAGPLLAMQIIAQAGTATVNANFYK
jgi:hypothetical protein